MDRFLRMAAGERLGRRKRDSKRRWKARWELGKEIPAWAIAEAGILVDRYAYEWDLWKQTVRRI